LPCRYWLLLTGPKWDSICGGSLVVESSLVVGPGLSSLCSVLLFCCRPIGYICSCRAPLGQSKLYDRNHPARWCLSALLPERQHPNCHPFAGTLLLYQRCCWFPQSARSGLWAHASIGGERAQRCVYRQQDAPVRGRSGGGRTIVHPSSVRAGGHPGRKRTKPCQTKELEPSTCATGHAIYHDSCDYRRLLPYST
jgi:hypothetical protein